MDFEFIDEGDMDFIPRGRRSSVPAELVTAIAKLGKGKAIRVSSMKVDVTKPTAKTDKARVSATIRQAGAQAKTKVTIAWSLDGTPQVIRK